MRSGTILAILVVFAALDPTGFGRWIGNIVAAFRAAVGGA